MTDDLCKRMTPAQFAQYFDHTLLKAFALTCDFEKLCKEAALYQVKMVAVNPAPVAVCKRFLGFAPAYLGEIRSDRAVTEAVRKQKPFAQMTPLSPASVDCMAAANTLQRLRENMLRTEEITAPLNSIVIQDF